MIWIFHTPFFGVEISEETIREMGGYISDKNPDHVEFKNFVNTIAEIEWLDGANSIGPF